MTFSVIGSVPGVNYTRMDIGASSGVSRGLAAAGNTDNAIHSLFANGVPEARPVSAADVQAKVDRKGGIGVFNSSRLDFLVANAGTPGSEHHVGSRQLLDLANQISLLHATTGANGPAMDQKTFEAQAKVLDKLATAFLAGPGNKTAIGGFVAGRNDHEKIPGVKQAINIALANCDGNISAQLFERVSMPIAKANVQGWQNEHGEHLSPKRAFEVAAFGKGSNAAMAQLGQQLTEGVSKLDSDTLAFLINHSIRQIDLRQGPAAAPALNMPPPGITGAHPNVLAPGNPGSPSIVNNNTATGGAVGPITLSTPSDGMLDIMTLMAKIAEQNAARLVDVNKRHNAEVKELYERLVEAKNVVPKRILEAPVRPAVSDGAIAESRLSTSQPPVTNRAAAEREIPVTEKSTHPTVPTDAGARTGSDSVNATGRASLGNRAVPGNGSGTSESGLRTGTVTIGRGKKPLPQYPEKVVIGNDPHDVNGLVEAARGGLTAKLKNLPAAAAAAAAAAANSDLPLKQLVTVRKELGRFPGFYPGALAKATRDLFAYLGGTLECSTALLLKDNPVAQLKVQLQDHSETIALTPEQKATFDRLVDNDSTFAAHYARVLKQLSDHGHRGHWVTQNVDGSDNVLHRFKLGFLTNLDLSQSDTLIATNQGLRNSGILPSKYPEKQH